MYMNLKESTLFIPVLQPIKTVMPAKFVAPHLVIYGVSALELQHHVGVVDMLDAVDDVFCIFLGHTHTLAAPEALSECCELRHRIHFLAILLLALSGCCNGRSCLSCGLLALLTAQVELR